MSEMGAVLEYERGMIFSRSFAILSLCIFSSLQAATLDRVVAVVGDKPILRSDVASFQNELKSSPALAGIYQFKPEDITFEKTLQKMIEEKIIQSAAQALDVRVTDVEVENQVLSIAKQNNMTRAQLEQSLKREGIAMEGYTRNIRSQLERRNVFDRELRRGGGGASDNELRSLYEKNAPQEYKISMATFQYPKNPKDRAGIESKIKEISARLSSKEITVETARKDLEAESIDWLTQDSINQKILESLKKASAPSVQGPFKVDNNWTLVIYEEKRRGSEEGFVKAKEELAGRIQGQEFERRFDAWIEKKKQEMHIVINKAAEDK